MPPTDSNNDVRKNWGELSVFQRVMRQWAEVHPYNAVHGLCFEGHADLEKLTLSIEQAWRALDFGTASLEGARYRFSYPAGWRPEVEMVDLAGRSVAETIDSHLADQLNFRFPTQDYAPVRFSVVQDTTCHYLYITYDHWIGDGTAIRTLLRPVLDRYCGSPSSLLNEVEKIRFYPPTYRVAYRSYFRPKILRFFQWWRGIIANNVNLLMPPHERKVEDMSVEYLSRDLPDAVLQNLLACAERHGVTVNDLFLAAITRSCMPHFPERLVRRKRRKMGIGSIVNSRAQADVNLDNGIGIYLGYFVTHSRSDQADTLPGLARVIAKETGKIKEKKAYLNTAIGMKIQSLLWPMIPRCAKVPFLRNSLPLSAGITNAYVKDAWLLDLCRLPHRRLLGYSRAAPTGPIIPISFAPTTLANTLHLGVTWRSSYLTRDIVETIVANIENDLAVVDMAPHRKFDRLGR